MKAIVLAAGLGTRLRPFTCATPKPLMPVWGVTMLERIVTLLREHGVHDIVVNCHYLHEQVEEWCAAHDCRAAYEPEILGTGGVVNPLRDWIGDEPFFLVNGDIIVENVPDELFLSPEAVDGKEVIARALVTEQGPRTIEVEPTLKYVTNFKSDDPGWDGTYTYAGAALLSPKILDYVEPSGFSTIIAAYEKAMMEGHFVKAVSGEDLLWTDAGTVDSYIELNRILDEKGNETENAFADLPQVRSVVDAAKLKDDKVTFLGLRGSERVFFRTGGAIVIAYNDEVRKENGRYVGHAKWLKEKGISVPEIVADLPAKKVMAMSDAGSEKRMTLEDYVKVVEHLVKFAALGSAKDLPDLEQPFGAALFKWERDLFAEHCLGTRFHREMSKEVAAEFDRISKILEAEPPALVHRDFQSSNILWKGDKFTFIDFQGMRLGPAAYDLASLVYDPYIAHDLNTLRAGTMKEGERRALVALYAKKCGREELVKAFPFAAVQRLSQCLGAYGRLASVGQPQFGKYVLPALVNLLDAADRAGLDAIGGLAEELIAAESKSHGHHGHDDHDCHCHGHDDHDCHCHGHDDHDCHCHGHQ